MISDNKITDRSLLMLVDSDLQEMQITAIGPRKIILASIEHLRTAQPTESLSQQQSGIEGTRGEDLRAILVQDVAFRNIVYDQLDQKIVPVNKHLHEMVRILCTRFEKSMYDGNRVSTNDEWQLAKHIIRSFPHLKSTRMRDDAPDESAFFWWCSGNESGDHSGYIYNRVRNLRKRLPKHMKKYNRPTRSACDSIPTSLIQRALVLASLNANVDNSDEISKEMAECFPFHQLLLKENKTFNEILQTFPHFALHNGIMIHEAFYRMNPEALRELEFGPIWGRAPLFATEMFVNVEDAHVKGTLRIFATLHKKGLHKSTSNQAENQAGPSNPIRAEQILVTPLLQWSQDLDQHFANCIGDPHIVCEAAPFKSGLYSIVFNNIRLATNESFVEILDLFWKSFEVFGVAVPSKLQMLHDVFSILVYKNKQQSTRKCVNNMCSIMEMAIKAEKTPEA